MDHTVDEGGTTPALEFQSLVASYYRSLYRFAYNLTRTETDAGDLTQQTFYLWATRGHQLQDDSKVKAWLFTTLYREFLKQQQKRVRFPHREISEVNDELPTISPTVINQLDCAAVLQSLGQVDDLYQVPLVLFYLENHPYKEIADMLEVPIGTVQSRIARGKAQLLQILTPAVVERTTAR
jgi:RNA polymerase sigma-70 factor (ECF subfamily)